jgi:hypothetical protein
VKIGTISHPPQRVTISGTRASAAVPPASMNLEGLDDVRVTGSTVHFAAGPAASLGTACQINVSGNSYPGGSREKLVTNPAS